MFTLLFSVISYHFLFFIRAGLIRARLVIFWLIRAWLQVKIFILIPIILLFPLSSQNLLLSLIFVINFSMFADFQGSGRLCSSIAASVSYLAPWSDNNHLLADLRARGHWSWWIFPVERRASTAHSTDSYHPFTRLGLDAAPAASLRTGE